MTDPKDPAKSPGDPKKSESLEVRVPWRLKQEFMARARREGRSASEVIRDLMQDYVRRPAQRPLPQTLETAMTAIRKRPAFAAVLGAAGVSALLASTIPAGAAPDLRAEFAALDANGDGAVTTEELNGGLRVDPLIVHSQQPPAEEHGAAVLMRVLLVPGSGEPGERRILIEQPAGAEDGESPDWRAHLIAAFAAGDTDGDGQLSLQEYIARDQWARDMSFATLDANKDGAIDASETIAVDVHHDPAAAAAIEALASLDADSDGRITRAEYDAAL